MKLLHFSIPATQGNACGSSGDSRAQAQSTGVHHSTFALSKTDTRILLDGRHDASKKKLVAHWLMDENSKLYCQWVLED